jgi:hypothetical protein
MVARSGLPVDLLLLLECGGNCAGKIVEKIVAGRRSNFNQ